MKDDTKPMHQSLLPPAGNKFHVGNGEDGKPTGKQIRTVAFVHKRMKSRSAASDRT